MAELNALINHEDFEHYRESLAGHAAGRVDSQALIAERLRLGIYAQRQEGLCMVRAKLPGGRVAPRALTGFAECLEHYSGHDAVHLTTRQDIQFHDVALERTPDLLEHLALFGVGSREAGGNTVRNITACPLAGACPYEHTDVQLHLQRTARHFVRHPLTQSLPRKFKISFSGCAADCADGAIHDLAVIATRRDGAPGFRLAVGGGLGAAPRQAVVLDEFVPEAGLLPAIEAVLALHDRHSDRKRKTRSRIKFVVERLGSDAFRTRYREELARTRAAFDEDGAPRGAWREAQPVPAGTRPGVLRAPVAQRQAGYRVVPVHVPHGDLDAVQLRGLVRILDRFDLDDLRVTQDQDLAIFRVPETDVPALVDALAEIDLGPPRAGDRVIACPGTATCTLGITASAQAAQRLGGGPSDLAIRVNGCQNKCANTDIADIGCYGLGRRHHDRLVPCYRLQLGGDGRVGGAYAFDGPEIPAARIDRAVARIEAAYRERCLGDESFAAWARRETPVYFADLLDDLAAVGERDLDELTRDHGDDNVFRIQSVGLGECAGVGTDPVEKGFLDADYERRVRDALTAKGKYDDALASLAGALLAAGNARLASAGADPADRLDVLPAVYRARFPGDDGAAELEGLLETLRTQQVAWDELVVPELNACADAWIERQRTASRPARAADPFGVPLRPLAVGE